MKMKQQKNEGTKKGDEILEGMKENNCRVFPMPYIL
jgi:hypothetical protein